MVITSALQHHDTRGPANAATGSASVTCPVLAIHGAHDGFGSTRHPEMIAQLSSGESRCAIIADTCHVPHRERGELVVNLVCEFVASIDPALRS